MIDRRFKLELLFEVSFADIAPGDGPAGLREHAERERRLLHALLSDDVTLPRFVARRVVDALEAFPTEELAARLAAPDGDDFEILKPAISMMRDDDAIFFERCEREGLFPDNTEDFYGAMRIELADARLTEVEETICDETDGAAS